MSQRGRYIERSNEPDQIGFAGLVEFLASDPDRSTSFFKAFHKEALEDIIFMEAEIAELNVVIEGHFKTDLKGDMEDMQCARSWTKFAASTSARQQEKKGLLLKRRALMREYRVLSAHSKQLDCS
ncbi:uncharacterized protein PAC_05578 [Phialocephala subalpina]|uniref:Uncharacterized protein n=1 Tax=Phialocephala subalpina TaxID=576137 RepID=A0A1L7WSD9_9HELO|nr:uncharacterized protein PAC_05578 [Phialocephala subalpina]